MKSPVLNLTDLIAADLSNPDAENTRFISQCSGIGNDRK